MKIIAEDVHSRPSVADILVHEHLPRTAAEDLAHQFNRTGGPLDEKHYRAVPDDYQLRQAQ